MQEDLLILLSRYLHNELSPPEREALEVRILSDPRIAEALQELQSAEMAIQAKGDQLLREQLNQKGKEFFEPTKVQTKTYWPWIGIAAAVVILLLSFFYFQPFSSGPAWREMAEAFPLPGPPASARSNDELSNLRQSGTEAYLKLQHQKAIKAWRQYLSDTLDTEIQFYVGVAYWQMGQTDSARYYMDQVPESSSLSQRASWYQVAVCVKEQNLSCLQEKLNHINQQSGHYKQELAKEWLEDLK